MTKYKFGIYSIAVMKNIFFSISVALITLLICLISPKLSEKIRPPSIFTQNFVHGEVLSVIEEDLTPDPVVKNRYRGSQKLRIKITSGSYKGQEFDSYNTLSSLHHTRAYSGLKAVFTVRETDSTPSVWLYNQKRDGFIYFLAALFLIGLLIMGRRQGAKSVLALIFTCVLIIYVLIPLLFAGFPAVPVSILLVSIITVVSFFLISGFSVKTYSAILGTIFGIGIAGILALVIGALAQLSGINMQSGEQLLNIAADYNIKLGGLLFTSVLIASLGAVMDVAMSIASSIQEIYSANPAMTRKALFFSGMNVGKDVTGTMSNTLILAFAGGSLPLMMMIWGFGMTYAQFINIPLIVIEIMHGLAGSIGILVSVPFTAAISVFMTVKKT